MANFNSGLDPYFLYYSCYLNPDDAPTPTQIAAATLKTHFRRMNSNIKAQPACAHHNDSVVYLQQEDVRKALHILTAVPPYQTCKYLHFEINILDKRLS
ncbi:unnamed protein product [Strongylus vulgaris]|uniref:Uncharacterized protein n=1 Tax=Strongylus vulgaris TaxID=40348 RepID=A0A3P7K3W7_STRVU|nr:unnamed protein product [Strongylus vulgaris]